MVSDPQVFGDLAFVFLAAVVGGSLAWALRQPLILGYVFGGLLISPFTPGPSVSDPRSFDLFAEIGVVLLMFSIGLEFSVRDLMRVKWIALLGGPLGGRSSSSPWAPVPACCWAGAYCPAWWWAW